MNRPIAFSLAKCCLLLSIFTRTLGEDRYAIYVYNFMKDERQIGIMWIDYEAQTKHLKHGDKDKLTLTVKELKENHVTCKLTFEELGEMHAVAVFFALGTTTTPDIIHKGEDGVKTIYYIVQEERVLYAMKEPPSSPNELNHHNIPKTEDMLKVGELKPIRYSVHIP